MAIWNTIAIPSESVEVSSVIRPGIAVKLYDPIGNLLMVKCFGSDLGGLARVYRDYEDPDAKVTHYYIPPDQDTTLEYEDDDNSYRMNFCHRVGGELGDMIGKNYFLPVIPKPTRLYASHYRLEF